MRIRLLTDEEHTAAAARLAGAETVLLNAFDGVACKAAWDSSVNDKEIAVLMLSPGVYRVLRMFADEHEKTGKTPFIVHAPFYGGGVMMPPREGMQ